MKKKLFTLFLALISSIGIICAVDREWINDIYYEFNAIGWQADIIRISCNESVVIPDSVHHTGHMYTIRKIGPSVVNYAYYACPEMTSIEIPSTITSIGESAFSQCSNLTTVNINDLKAWCGIYVYGNPWPRGTLHDLYRKKEIVTDLVIPTSAHIVGAYIFSECGSLTSVEIHQSVTEIGESAFSGCTSLKAINVAQRNSNYCSTDGVLFNKNKTTLIQYPGGKQGEYTIPNSVTSIEKDAFYGCSSLTSINIPNSVTSIGESAFEKCSSLTSITCSAKNPPELGSGVWENVDCSKVPLYVPAGSVNIYKTAEQWKDFNSILPIGGATIKEYTISVSSDNTSMGTVSGGGTYEEGMTVTVTATPKLDYKFTKWSDNSTDNPYSFIVTKNANLVAYFESVLPAGTITCAQAAKIAAGLNHNTPTSETYTVVGYVTETDGKVSKDQQVFWMADAKNGGRVLKSYWCNVPEQILVGDRVYIDGGKILRYNSTYEITNGNVVLLARNSSSQTFTVSVSSNNTSMGTVSGGGTYSEGTTATITATPKSGYKFTKWSNNSTKNPYSFSVTENVSLVAYFEKDGTTPSGSITCEQAAQIAAGLENNTPTSEIYTVVGYVTEIAFPWQSKYNSVSFWIADKKNGGNVLKAFKAVCNSKYDEPYLNDYVRVTGKLARYGTVREFAEGCTFEIIKEGERESAEGTKTSGVTATPTEEGNVILQWPTVDDAFTYSVTIAKNGEVICILVFDAEGRLNSISFAPMRDGNSRNITAAEQVANGWKYEIKGLEPGTEYSYTLIAQSESGATLSKETGTFITKELNALVTPSVMNGTSHKLIYDGQVLILRGNKTYTLTGQEVK